MKVFIIVALMAFSYSTMSMQAFLIGGAIPGGNVLSNLTIRPLPTLNNKFDPFENLVKVATVSAHELTHVIQQRGTELRAVIEETKNGNGDESFKNLLSLIFKDGIKVNVSDLSNYILHQALLKDSPKMLSAAKNYGNSKEQLDFFNKSLNGLKARAAKCEKNNACAVSELLKLKGQIQETEKSITEKMAQMNMQFLALQEAIQMESRKFQTLSNLSKARHDTARNAISNMKA